METIYLNLTEPQNGLHIEQLGHSTCTRHYGDIKRILGFISLSHRIVLHQAFNLADRFLQNNKALAACNLQIGFWNCGLDRVLIKDKVQTTDRSLQQFLKNNIKS